MSGLSIRTALRVQSSWIQRGTTVFLVYHFVCLGETRIECDMEGVEPVLDEEYHFENMMAYIGKLNVTLFMYWKFFRESYRFHVNLGSIMATQTQRWR